MRGISNNKAKIKSWKEKAKSRSKTISEKNKRIKYLESSRDKWKRKYFDLKRAGGASKRELDGKMRMPCTAVKNHSYSSELIQLCVQLRSEAGCSYRGCIKVLNILALLLNLELKIPSLWSVRNWEIKLGYQQIRDMAGTTGKWVLIIDESISIGSQKMLLLIGVDLGRHEFGKALDISAVKVLEVRLKKSWKAHEIKKVVDSVAARGYDFEYCCCDNGNNLRKMLGMAGLPHIEDCGHALGKWLEKRYKGDNEFVSFCEKTTRAKRQLILSRYAEYVPPKHRTKGRFLNLTAIASWAGKLLSLAKQYQRTGECPEAFEKIEWILGHETFIRQLGEEQGLINKVNKLIKNGGLGDRTIARCRQLVESASVNEGLKAHVLDYLARNRAKLPDLEKIVCSSDIIESMFGKFKYNTAKSPGGAITEACLSVANYGRNYKIAEIKTAMEQVKIVDIKKWRGENIPVSVQQKKRMLMKKLG